MEEYKKILIVDDSEIDREVLKSILEDEFEVLEADNGYVALEMMMSKESRPDAVLLDLSMPLLDGLSVLRIMRENHLDDISVFMVTVEATKANIEKASQYHIDQFIKKPFDREEILKRVREKLGVEPKTELSASDMEETRKYISRLEELYNLYLRLSGKDTGRDERRAVFMRILLERNSIIGGEKETEKFRVEMLSKAAYLCNIGEMLLRNEAGNAKTEADEAADEKYRQHTVIGAKLVALNNERQCRKFVRICTDLCLNHHERCDGRGFPNGVSGSNFSIYAQLCGLLERFDDLFFKYKNHNEIQFDYVISYLKKDIGFVSERALTYLINSKEEILTYYARNYT